MKHPDQESKPPRNRRGKPPPPDPHSDGTLVAVKVGHPIQHIAGRLHDLGAGWPCRVDGLLFAPGPDHSPLWLENPAALLGWANGLLPGAGHNRLRWAQGEDKVSEARF